MTQQKELYAPAGANCRPGLALLPRYITIHNTANTSKGAGAQSHAAYLRGAGKDKYVSWHYAVDDKLITHCIPDGEVAWHAGDGGNGTGNRQSLAIEICENPESDLLAATDMSCEPTGLPSFSTIQTASGSTISLSFFSMSSITGNSSGT